MNTTQANGSDDDDTQQISYAELTRQLAIERAKSEALQLQLRRIQKKGRKVNSHGDSHTHSISMDSNASTPSIPDRYKDLTDAFSVDEALEAIRKQCEMIGLDKSTEQMLSALKQAHNHVQMALAILAGEPVIFDGSDNSDAETNKSLSDDDENESARPSLPRVTYKNNRLDTDENGNSIFIDVTHSSVDPLSHGFVAGAPTAKQGTFSTAGYDHNEEQLMDVQCVEADWSKLRLSKEVEYQLKISKRSARGDYVQSHALEKQVANLRLDSKAFPFVQKSPAAGVTSTGTGSARKSGSITSTSSLGSSSGAGLGSGNLSNRSSQNNQPSPIHLLSNGVNAKGFGNESALKELLEAREKRRKLERQRELFRLPARESWRYASDQPPCANIREFCFPNGVLAQYVSKNAAEHLIGEKFDRYHLVQLTSANGQATYACVLTVTKIVSAAFAPTPVSERLSTGGSAKAEDKERRESPLEEVFVVNALESMMSLKKPARIIRSFMRRLIKFIKKQRWDNVMHGNFTGHMGGGASHNENGKADDNSNSNNNIGTDGQPVSRATRMMQIIADATGGRHSSQVAKQAALSGVNPSNSVSPARGDERATSSRTFMSSLFGSSAAASPAPAPSPAAPAASSGFLSRWSSSASKAPESSPAKAATVSGISSGLVSSTNQQTEASSSATTDTGETEDLLGITTNFNGETLTSDISKLKIEVDTPPASNQGPLNSHTNNIPRKMSMAINRKNSDGTPSSTVTYALNRDKDFSEALKSMPAGIAGLPMSLPTADDDSSEDSTPDGSQAGDTSTDVKMTFSGDMPDTSETLITWDDVSATNSTPRSEEMRDKPRGHALQHKCIVSEIAYCLVSTKPIQALGFKILKAMADAERQVLVEGGESGENDIDPYARERKRTFSGNSAGSFGLLSSGGDGKDSNRLSKTSSPISNHDVGMLLDMEDSPRANGKARVYHAESTHHLSPMQLSDLSVYRNAFLHRVHQQICRWSALGGLKLFLASNFSSSLTVSKTLKGNVAKQRPKSERRSLMGAMAAGGSGSVKWEADGKPNVTMSPDASASTSVRTRSRTSSTGGGIAQSRRIPQEVHAIISGYLNATPDLPDGFVVNLSTLPSVDELSAAVMFSYLNSSMIFKLVNLLLMEKSLVICGKNSGIVSNIALAVKNLILPFRWEGVFVPLVPDSARELFGAPVPYILGTTTSPRDGDVSPSAAILYLQDDENIATTMKNRSDLNGPEIKSPSPGSAKSKQDKKGSGSGSGATTTSAGSSGTSGSTPTTAASSTHTPVEKKKGGIETLGRSRSKTAMSRLQYTGREAEHAMHIDFTSSAQQAGFTATLPETVAWFIRLPDSLNADMPHDEQLECMIDDTKRYLRRSRAMYCAMQLESDYLQHLQQGGTNSTFIFSRQPTLDVQYLLSMTRKEQRAVATLVRALYEHNVRFCGDAIDPTAWRRYVRYNDMTGEEEFYPNWFMEPVRRHVEFQEAVVQTQLFVGFMDHVREESASKDKDRVFIRDWVGFRMHLHKLNGGAAAKRA